MTTAITAEEAKTIEINPVIVGNLAAFVAAVMPIAQQMMRGDVVEALIKHTDNVITATAIGACVPRDRLDASGTDALAILAARVMEVNADFFARRLLPELTQVAGRIGATFSDPSIVALTTGLSASQQPESTTAA